MFSLDELSIFSTSGLLDLSVRTARLRSRGGISKALDDALDALQNRIAARLHGAPSLVHVAPGEGGGFVATGPNGATSQAHSLEEVLRRLAEAISISPPGG